MKKLIHSEVRKKWNEIGRITDLEQLALEFNVYKKFIELVQVGESYFFTFHPGAHRIEFVSENITSVLGYSPEEFTVEFVLNNIHPEDLPYFGDFEATVVHFKKQLPLEKIMKYKTRYNYRLRNKKGEYVHILQQSITIEMDDSGAVLRNFVIHTDISQISHFQKMQLSFIGLDGEPSYIHVPHLQKFSSQKEVFTNREKEILHYIVQGCTSQEISGKMHRSIHTIQTHRKNILHKSGCKNLNELLIKSVKEGWV